jgi:hypothetical protein
MGTVEPCQLALPHIHPKASEFLLVADGPGGLETGFLLDDLFTDDSGTPIEVRATLGRGQGTLFPQGAIHWQFNPTCHNMTTVVTFSSADPGFQFLGTSLFDLTEEVYAGALGYPKNIDGESLEMWKKKIPFVKTPLPQECLKRCNLTS